MWLLKCVAQPDFQYSRSDTAVAALWVCSEQRMRADALRLSPVYIVFHYISDYKNLACQTVGYFLSLGTILAGPLKRSDIASEMYFSKIESLNSENEKICKYYGL